MSELLEQGPLALFFALVIGHALADFPLQGAYLSIHKSREGADGTTDWIVALAAHSLIHAGAVWLLTGSMILGLVELVLHAAIDFGKCEKRYGLLADQSMHLLCKIGFVIFLFWGPGTG